MHRLGYAAGPRGRRWLPHMVAQVTLSCTSREPGRRRARPVEITRTRGSSGLCITAGGLARGLCCLLRSQASECVLAATCSRVSECAHGDGGCDPCAREARSPKRASILRRYILVKPCRLRPGVSPVYFHPPKLHNFIFERNPLMREMICPCPDHLEAGWVESPRTGGSCQRRHGVRR